MGLRVIRSEECGNSWGESIDRAKHTAIEKSKESAAILAKRVGSCAWAIADAVAAQIREIRTPDKPDVQILFVLDDGGMNNPGHAVLRAADGCKKHDVTEARRQLVKLFRVSQIQDAKSRP